MSLKLEVNASEIAAQFKELALEVEQDINRGIASVAAMTHAKVAEMAAEELNTTLKTLQDSLGFEEISQGVWVVSIDEKALWIEEGIEPNKDMKPDLLRGARKTSKKGHKYRPIPFDYGKAPSQMSPQTEMLVAKIKQHLKKEKIPFKKIEKHADGKTPKLGKLHEFTIDSERPSARASTPALQNVSIYQSRTSTGNVRRDILTFRTVSESPASQGKWIHPGLTAKKFLDRAFEFAVNKWENEILPEILKKYSD